MTSIQIRQLHSAECISLDRQQQIFGSGAGPHNVKLPYKSEEELWSGYTESTYDITTSNDGEYINFKDDGSTIGRIVTSTGGSIMVPKY